ncbi:unnamed protein product [Linum trigynum]|uniref:Glutaredoxin domain-containing protein n=1 Tax=Linum trigynum TaxID=586398 RepID=A0AAV2D9W8_9ROSI
MNNSTVVSSRKERFLHKLKLIGLVPQPQTNYHLNKTTPQIKEAEEEPHDQVAAVRCPPGGAEAAILYTTSLRSIRKTFEDCHSIRFLLQSFKVAFQERDVAMDLGFRDELWKVIGGGGRVVPPRLFVRGKYIGGADEVITLHEQGKLRKLFDGIPTVGSPAGNCGCAGCGNLRFVVCTNCNGRRKVVAIGGGEQEGGGGGGGDFVRCLECNENGLMKCRICS